MTSSTEPRTVVPVQAGGADARAVADAYVAAWNAHDGAAVAALVSGTYHDPTLPEPVSGADLAAYVDGLCAAFPDLRFDHDGEPVVSGDRVVSPWRMRGTNDGAPLPGAPAPTNGTCDLAGIDVITVVDGRVSTVQGYFDQKALVEQLGLQAIVAPKDEWPVSFGVANRVDLGNTATPGAISMTTRLPAGCETSDPRHPHLARRRTGLHRLPGDHDRAAKPHADRMDVAGGRRVRPRPQCRAQPGNATDLAAGLRWPRVHQPVGALPREQAVRSLRVRALRPVRARGRVDVVRVRRRAHRRALPVVEAAGPGHV